MEGNPKDQIREASEDDNRALIFEPVTDETVGKHENQTDPTADRGQSIGFDGVETETFDKCWKILAQSGSGGDKTDSVEDVGVVSPVAKCTEDFLSGKRTVSVKFVLIINDDTGQNDLTLPWSEEGESLEQEREGVLGRVGKEGQEDKEAEDGETTLDEKEILPRLQSTVKTQDARSHKATDTRNENVANEKDGVSATEFGSLVESGDSVEGTGDV